MSTDNIEWLKSNILTTQGPVCDNTLAFALTDAQREQRRQDKREARKQQTRQRRKAARASRRTNR
jgi:hypothetical protein